MACGSNSGLAHGTNGSPQLTFENNILRESAKGKDNDIAYPNKSQNTTDSNNINSESQSQNKSNTSQKYSVPFEPVNDSYFTNDSPRGKQLIEYVQANGDKITPSEVIGIGEDNYGNIIWLETGKASGKASGLAHILEEHEADFNNQGIASEDIASLILRTAFHGLIVGYQGKGTSRPIYEIYFKGKIYKVAMTIGSNGYIVGANPR